MLRRPVRPSRRRVLVVTLAWLAAFAPLTARAEVVVSAAASLTDVLTAAAAAYERASGEHVALNFAASNTLARQIAAGAPVDLFVSADEAQMDVVAAHVAAGTRVDLLTNQLAIVVPGDRPRLTAVRDLLAAGIRRVALGDPAAVPAGVYARAWLERAGVWAAVSSKVVPAGSVRLALAAVERGAADAAIVYRTDVATAKGVQLAFVVPAAEAPAIRYPAAVLRAARNPDGARRFLTFLRGPLARAIFEEAGFGFPPSRPPSAPSALGTSTP